ncbi:hypothetical protein D3C72_1228280 [compost metagenome]
MVDVVHRADVVGEVDQVVDGGDDVFLDEHAIGLGHRDAQLLVHLVAADATEVVALGIEEAGEQNRATPFDGRHVAGAQLLVDLDEGVLDGLGLVRLEGLLEVLALTEEIQHLLVLVAHRAQQDGGQQLAGLVDADVDQVVDVGFQLQPGTPVGDDGGRVGLLTRGIGLALEVDTRRTHDLGDDDALGTVDDEGAVLGHDRQLADEDLLLLDFAGLLGDETDGNAEGLGVRSIPGAAFLDGILGLTQGIIGEEVKLETVRVIDDRREGDELLFQALIEEPFEGLLLDLDQIGKRGRERRRARVDVYPFTGVLRHWHHP